jgi:hypothetical protein
MTLQKQNPWKYLSVGLLGVIAIGLITPIDAKPAADNEGITNILGLLEDAVFGLAAISNDVAIVQTTSDDIFSAMTYEDDTFSCVGASLLFVCSNECDESSTDRVVKLLEFDEDSGVQLVGPNLMSLNC